MTKRDIIAGEYALGTLDAREHARAEMLLASDPTFARAVQGWEKRLSPLSEAVDPVEPPPSAWGRIEMALDATAVARRTQLTDLAAQLAELRRGLNVWRYAAMSAAAAALAMAVVWLGGLPTPFHAPAPERYVAMLQSKEGKTGFVVTMETGGNRRFIIRPVAAQTPPEKSYELWCIMKGSDDPVITLGIVPTEQTAIMDVPWELDRKTIENGVELAISLEPEGGAPSGRSMGPIMFAGLLVQQTP